MELFFKPSSFEHQKKERSKARLMKHSLWWKQQLGKGICHYCGQRFLASELTMDHKIPIIRGGTTNKKNVVVSCRSCNSKKKYLLPGENRDVESTFQWVESKTY